MLCKPMPGRTYHPLETAGDDNEYTQFRQAAKDGDILDEVIGLTLLDTGIRCSTMAHMQESWLRLNDDQPELFVPLGEECRLGTGDGKGGDTTPDNRGQPCYQCRTRPDKQWAPDTDWHPKTRSARRTIPLRNDDTIQALDAYFTLEDTVAGVNTVINRVKWTAERAELSRTVTPHDLRDTFGTRLAKMEFGVHHIKDLMGHAGIDQAVEYVKLTGTDIQEQFDEKWE